MKEKVIIEQITISKKEELKAFQIRLPMDAKKIIGIETTVTRMDVPIVVSFSLVIAGVPVFQNTPIAGELRMQSCGKANLFYATDVAFSDPNLGYGDFWQDNSWIANQWIAGYKKEEEEVRVMDCCPVISGTYRDKRGELQQTDLSYIVNLYLWYATE